MYFNNGTEPSSAAAAAAHYLAIARGLAAYDLSYAHTFFWTAHDTQGKRASKQASKRALPLPRPSHLTPLRRPAPAGTAHFVGNGDNADSARAHTWSSLQV